MAIVVGGWHHDSAPHPLTEVALHVYNHAQRGDDALRFLPGSHALPTGLNPRDIASLAHADPRACPGEFGGVAVPAEPGDVIAFDARLWRHYPGSGALAARLLRFRVLNVNEADGAGTTLTIERPDREG
ncbi:MAG: phytanoyl-CoA dioxygenase family protein [Sporichthyaceae bacterium]